MTPDALTFIYGLLCGAGITLLAQRLHRYLIDNYHLGEPSWAEAVEVYERRRHHPSVVAVRQRAFDWEQTEAGPFGDRPGAA